MPGVLMPMAPYNLLPCRLDSFAFGGYLALVSRGDPAEVVRMRRLAPMLVAGSFVGLAALYVAGQGLRPFEGPQRTLDFTLLALGFGGLLVMVLESAPQGACRKLFESRPLMTVAKYSYGLYVVHLVAAFALIPWVAHTWWTNPVYGSFIFANLGFVVLAGGMSLVLAWTSWHLLEKRAIALKRYVPYGTAPAREPPRRAVTA
jgi:peptidoglycan/LPS O-acetylase OafA/YrhL